jgi:hypothetical protein
MQERLGDRIIVCQQRIKEPIDQQTPSIGDVGEEGKDQTEWCDLAHAIMVFQVDGNDPTGRQNETVGSKHMDRHIGSGPWINIHGAPTPMEKGLVERQEKRRDNTDGCQSSCKASETGRKDGIHMKSSWAL